MIENKTGLEIAVIGMSGRFPGSRNIDEFWNNLKEGIESIGFLSPEELEAAGVDTEMINNPHYVNSKGGVLEESEYFDASFFDYNPVEAQLMDPQIRIFHECCWEALENAGYNPNSFSGLIGLYAGGSTNFNWETQVTLSGKKEIIGSFAVSLLCSQEYLCTRVAYALNLKGPCVRVQTACSTSLVSIHMACRALLTGECDIALAGGVSIQNQNNIGYIYQDGLIESSDGHCRAFDAKASGSIGGEGVGVVVLKRLKYSLEDQDTIDAVIKGSAINNDGLRKIGFTAPSIEGQSNVIKNVLKISHVNPESINYVECHGTGTPLGDPIEIEALKRAFNTEKRQYCAIGSVKTNIGHLNAASGVTGFIKTVLTLKNRIIPPSLNYESANPEIDFENSPFYVNTTLSPWPNGVSTLRAGVSSFGLGGTNAHVILEEAPPLPSIPPDLLSSPQPQLLLISAKTEQALKNSTRNLKKHLETKQNLNLADIAYTLQVGRKAFNCRRMLVSSTVNEALKVLSTDESAYSLPISSTETKAPPIIFMFSGQGSQYVNMGVDLYQNEPRFRCKIDQYFNILESIMGYNIKNILYPLEENVNKAKEAINGVLYSGPIKFIFELAMAELVIDSGIQPYALIGHSFGEYTAACLAGVFSPEDALRLVVARGQLMNKTAPGIMMGVPLHEDQLKPLLGDNISLAAVNAPSHCIISGPTEAVSTLEKELDQKGCECVRLNFPHASHSRMMMPILDEFKGFLSRITFHPPRIRYISGVTGKWISIEQSMSPDYWASHLIQTIRFADGIKELSIITHAIFLQVSCDRGLTLFVKQHPNITADNLILNLVKHKNEEVSDNYYLLNQIGRLWVSKVEPHWNKFHGETRRRRVHLPAYPFERTRYNFEKEQLKEGLNNLLKKSSNAYFGYYASHEDQSDLDDNYRQNVTSRDNKHLSPKKSSSSKQPRPDLRTAYVIPNSYLEQDLVEIWKDLFGYEQIGINDNFFELGGDSLMVSIVTAKIFRQLKFKINIKDFFTFPTVKELAAYISTQHKSEFFAINPAEEKEYYPLSSAQIRMYVTHQIDKDNTSYNITQLLQSEEKINPEKLKKAFLALIKRHESLRTSFRTLAGKVVQKINTEADFTLECYEAPKKKNEEKIIHDFIKPFDLSKAPLMRAGLLQCGDRGDILIIDSHHIISDAISHLIMEQDFLALYQGRPLPDLKLRYRDFSQWQTQMNENPGQEMKKQEQYWLNLFAGEIPRLNLPFDYEEPIRRRFEGSAVSFEMDKKKTEALRACALAEGITLFILLLSIYNILLSRICGQEDIIIGTPTAGRRHQDLQEMVGMLVNTLALRNFPKAEMTFREFLNSVKKYTLEAFENQDYQFNDLAAQVDEPKDINRNPIFDVVFAFQEISLKHGPGFEEAQIDQQSPPLKLNHIEYKSKAAKFDLILNVVATDKLNFSFEYSTRLFKKNKIERFIEYFNEITDAVMKDRNIKLKNIEISHTLASLESHDINMEFGF